MTAGTLFPDLPGYGGPHAAQHHDEAQRRAWWAKWDREHPPPKTCPLCGLLGGQLWLTTGGVGPRPWHQDCWCRYSGRECPC